MLTVEQIVDRIKERYKVYGANTMTEKELLSILEWIEEEQREKPDYERLGTALAVHGENK